MSEPIHDLIRRSTHGDELATERVLSLINQHHKHGYIQQYAGRNVLYDRDELDSAFMMGCFEAMEVVDPDLGNPLLFILWRGQRKMLGYIKKIFRRGLRLRCYDCGHRGAARRGRGKVKDITCGSCGSTNVDTFMLIMGITATNSDGEPLVEDEVATAMSIDDIPVEADLWFERMTHQIAIEEVREHLSDDAGVLRLFDKMIIEEINSQTTNNYLKEIADDWDITPQAVSYYLRRLRARLRAYYGLDSRYD